MAEKVKLHVAALRICGATGSKDKAHFLQQRIITARPLRGKRTTQEQPHHGGSLHERLRKGRRASAVDVGEAPQALQTCKLLVSCRALAQELAPRACTFLESSRLGVGELES